MPDNDLKTTIANELDVGRDMTWRLVAPLTDDDLVAQHSRIMSPLVWDLGHIANYEELWLLRQLTGRAATDPLYDDIYNAFEHPRWERPDLPLLGPHEARGYLDRIRGEALDVLDRVDIADGSSSSAGPADRERLLERGYVYRMVVQHEHMHNETMLATVQLMKDRPYDHGTAPAPPGGPVAAESVLVPGGPFVMGTDDDPWAYDNEHAAHLVDVPPFRMDTTPVTNGAYLQFVTDGGYDDERLWHPEGWAYVRRVGIKAPLFWTPDGAEWHVRRFGAPSPIDPDEPVQHVCWYEADAYARWAGKRLPTEAEWEKAASWSPDGVSRRHPWGDTQPTPGLANLGRVHFAPAPVGSYPSGASAVGCHQMLGEVWEWTASDFTPYPGYDWFPYREYSQVFFGDEYKVLRGGSWATHPTAARNTFRNWDYPIRRQIFCGFRCAEDA